jgi:hypothetical protein
MFNPTVLREIAAAMAHDLIAAAQAARIASATRTEHPGHRQRTDRAGEPLPVVLRASRTPSGC